MHHADLCKTNEENLRRLRARVYVSGLTSARMNERFL